MESKLQEYKDKFGEQFPLMMVRGMDDKDVVKLINDCLESEKPYEPDFNEGDVY